VQVPLTQAAGSIWMSRYWNCLRVPQQGAVVWIAIRISSPSCPICPQGVWSPPSSWHRAGSLQSDARATTALVAPGASPPGVLASSSRAGVAAVTFWQTTTAIPMAPEVSCVNTVHAVSARMNSCSSYAAVDSLQSMSVSLKLTCYSWGLCSRATEILRKIITN
jgi:hypothetical protein